MAASRARQRARVEHMAAVVEARHVGQLAAGQQMRGACGKRGDALVVVDDGGLVVPAQGHAGLARLDRRRHHLGERQLAAQRVGVDKAGDRARHGGRQHAVARRIALGVGVAVSGRRPLAVELEHRGVRRQGRPAIGVDGQEFARLGKPQRDMRVAADAAGRLLGDAGGEGAGDQRVDRVAALLHDAHAGLGAQRVATRTDPFSTSTSAWVWMRAPVIMASLPGIRAASEHSRGDPSVSRNFAAKIGRMSSDFTRV